MHWPAEAGFWLARAYHYFPPGTVHIAASAGAPATRALALAGGRNEIRRDTVGDALKLLWELLREDAP